MKKLLPLSLILSVIFVALFSIGHAQGSLVKKTDKIDQASKAKKQKTLSELIRLLKSPDANERIEAGLALVAMGNKAAGATHALVSALKDENSMVRIVAASALGSVGPAAAIAVPDLAAALKDEDPDVRAYAATALGTIGGRAFKASEALRAALEDENEEVRKRAAQALALVQEVRGEPSKLTGQLSGTSDSTRGRDTTGLQQGGHLEQPDRDKVRTEPEETSGALQKPILPPGGGTEDVPVQQLTYNGKTLGEWMIQLQSPQVKERLEAAKALGDIGPKAEPVVGPLNRSRLYDNHDQVRRGATVALCKILGVALGDLTPKPKAPSSEGTGPTAESGPVPEGRIYYLAGVHDVSEDGVEPLPDLDRESATFTVHLFGFTNFGLNYLDLAEAHKYRQEARARGLEANKRLFKLLESDPQVEQVSKKYKLFQKYKKDYIARITCNSQTRYRYYRWLDDKKEWYGGDDHLGMTPGNYTAEVAIWTQDGFRLDFKIPFTCKPNIDSDADYQDGLEQIKSPQDVGREKRQQILSLDSNQRGYQQMVANIWYKIAEEMPKVANDLVLYQAAMPHEVLPYIGETIFLHKRAGNVDPRYSLDTKHASDLVSLCRRLADREAYGWAKKITTMVEALLKDPKLKSQRRAYGAAHYYRLNCYSNLAEIALTYQCDINGFLRHKIDGLKHANLVIAPWDYNEKPLKIDIKQKRHEWPQPGWWNPAWDELQPPPPDTAVVATTGPKGIPAQSASAHASEALKEALKALDKNRADWLRWLTGPVAELLEYARQQRLEALGKLKELRKEIAKIQANIERIQNITGKTPDPMGREPGVLVGGPFEDWLYNLIKGSGGELKGQPLQLLKEKLDKLQKEQIRLERDRDQLIQDALYNYEDVLKKLKSEGLQCKWAGIRNMARGLIKHTQDRIEVVKCELYFNSGQDDKFRETARKCIEAKNSEYSVRLMEAVYFTSKGKLSNALRASHWAMDIEGLGEEGVVETTKDGTKLFRLTPAQQMVKGLEDYLLKRIDKKTGSDAAAIRKLCNKFLSEHGEPGFWGFLSDVLSTGVTTSFTGMADKLEDAEHPLDIFKATPVDKEATQAGKHESLAREQGIVLDDAARTSLGLKLIIRLRDKNVSLANIAMMDDEKFRATVAEKFGWKKMTKEIAVKFRKLIMWALQNTDVKRLLHWTPESTDLEVGRSYFDPSSFVPNWQDSIGDLSSAINVFLIFGPFAKVMEPGKATSLLDWAHPFSTAAEAQTMASEVVTLKEAFATTIGLPKLAAWASKYPVAERLMVDIAQLHPRLGLLARIGTDFALQYNATKWTEEFVSWAAGKFGAEEKTQKRIADLAGSLAWFATAYGVMDYDVTVNMVLKHGLPAQQVRTMAKALGKALNQADEVATLGHRFRNPLNATLDEIGEAGRLTPAHRKTIAQSADQLQNQMKDLAEQLAGDMGNPLVLREFQRLGLLWQSLEALRDGMPGQARAWRDFMDDLAEHLEKGRQTVTSQQRAFEAVANEVEGATTGRVTGTKIGGKPRPGQPVRQAVEYDVDFKKPSMMPHADNLVLKGDLEPAERAYGAALSVYKEIGLGDKAAATELAKRLYMVQEMIAAQDYLKALGIRAPANAKVLATIMPEEIEAIANHKNFRLEPIGVGASRPYWVMIGTKKIGIFKPDLRLTMALKFPYASEAEEVVPRMAKHLGIRAPASVRTKMPVGDAGDKVEGVFVRYVEGRNLLDCDLAQRLVLKKPISKDLVLRILVGDPDFHGLNYKIGGDGLLYSIDRNMSFFRYPRSVLKDAIGVTELSPDPIVRRQQILQVMVYQLQNARSLAHIPMYKSLAQLQDFMVYDDFVDAIKIVKQWDRKFLLKELGNAFGDQTDDVVKMLEMRIKLLDEAFKEVFPPMQNLPPPSAWQPETPTLCTYVVPEMRQQHEIALPLAA